MRKRSPQKQNDDTALATRFGAVVRIYRQRLGLSQEELAWRADIHRTYLADIERGGRNLTFFSTVRLVRALGISLAEFFFALEEYFAYPIAPALPAKPVLPALAAKSRKVKKRAALRTRNE